MNKLKLSLLAMLIGLGLTACQKPSETTATAKESTTKESTATETSTAPLRVKVGTTGAYYPFSYREKNNELTGYDIEVIKAIQAKAPDLKIEIVVAPWDALFPGLDSGKFDLLASQLGKTPEREKRYYLTEPSYFISSSKVIIRNKDTDINGLEDLKGRKLGINIGTTQARAVEDWNKAHDNILTIVNYEGNSEPVLKDLEIGRIDATVNDPIMAKYKAEVLGIDIRVVGDSIEKNPTYFLLRKDESGKAIKQRVDQALSELKADGSLSKLSIQWFEQDLSQ